MNRPGEEEANRLIDETSPYLLQHAHNPVEWYPWGPEALEKARREDKPILLSIGYAACHWCHVMERESFEDPEIAELMSDSFVCIKVDREERPDLDDIYMTAVQAMTGQGGWPLTVFLTPDLKPFWGGTYFPPHDRMGMPGLPTVLRSMAEAYREQRDRIESVSSDLAERLQADVSPDRDLEILDSDLVNAGVRQLRGRFDGRWGGFSSAPKFPQAGNIALLLRYGWHHGDEEARDMAVLTLDRMAAGGIHDQVGGGFHRYSTDERWLVPHFEKMLYDNALLAGVYLEAFQVTGDDRHRATAVDTLDWVIRDMQGEAGGYYSTLDADSEGEEGKFYVWKRAEVEEVLGEDAPLFCAAYDIVAGGNWEGKSIPNRKHDAGGLAREFDLSPEEVEERLERSRRRLREVREERVHPGLDDKVLTDWNGLMIAAMARAHRVTGKPRFLDSAVRSARFVVDELMRDDRLLHVWRDGEAKLLAYLDDHANMVQALVGLYETTFDLEWLRRARNLADRMIELFLDDEDGGFYFTGTDHEELIARRKTGHDGATPSGNAVAAAALQRLATLTGATSFRKHAVDTLHAFQAPMRRAPTAFATMLLAVDDYLQDPREIVVAADPEDPETDAALRRLWRQYAPSDVVVLAAPGAAGDDAVEELIPLLAGRTARDGGPTYYVCHDYTCEAPTDSIEEVIEARSR